MQFEGRVHKFGSNVDTDAMIAGVYCHITDPVELAKHCFERYDPDFVHRVQPGDILVAENNFGCGSSREVAPVAVKACGISCVVAKGFARIFFRNAVNIALPVVECLELPDSTQNGDLIRVDLDRGTVTNKTKNKTFSFPPYPPFIIDILNHGGLVPYVKSNHGKFA